MSFVRGRSTLGAGRDTMAVCGSSAAASIMQMNRGSSRPPGLPRTHRLRRAFRAWCERQTIAGAKRERDRALLAEVLSWLPEHYQREVQMLGQYSDRPEVFK